MLRKTTLRLAAVLLAISSLFAADLPLSELSVDRYKQHVSLLASESMKGRGNGSPELERAADYIASQFRSLGLKAAGTGGTYFQKFQLTVGTEFGSRNALRVSGAAKRRDQDFVTLPVSSSGEYEGPVVFAGYGITSQALGWDDYAGLDVTGKAVIVLRHDPEELNPGGRFAKDTSAPTTFLSKARNARQHGAKAILFVTDPNHHPKDPDTVGAATRDLESRDLSILAMHVTRAALAPLFERAGKDLAAAQKAIDDGGPESFELTDGRVRVVGDVRPVRKTVRNVLASVEGSDSLLKNEWVVIGAHYDHLGLGDANHSLAPADVGKIHHGADDNASGTAGVLELARLVQRNRSVFKRSVLFMTFAGEELGLFGSSHFVNNPTVPIASINAMINMDMIGRLGGRSLSVMGTGTSPDLSTWIAEANKPLGLTLALSNGGHEGSDHISFNGKKIPILFLFSGLHADYHRPTDTSEKVDADGAIKILSLAAGAAERIANAPTKIAYTEVKDERPQAAAGGGGNAYGTYFGSVPDFRDDLSGVLFADVRPDSPAGKAGLKAGDLLVQFAGEPIKNLYDFTDALAAKKPGDVVSVVVKRNGQDFKVEVTLDVRR